MNSNNTMDYRQPAFAQGDIAGQLEAFDRDGFCLIRDVLPADIVREARARIDELRPFHWDHQLDTDHYKCVFNRDSFWLPFLDWPGVIDLAERTLASDCHIIGQTAWRSRPGHRGVGMHIDASFWPKPPEWPDDVPYQPPVFIETAHFYLSDITLELCPTYVVAGSHRAGHAPLSWETSWRDRSAEPVLCRAGDVLLFRSDLWHSGSDNVSDRSRYLLQVHYSRRMIAQKFSPYISWRFNPDVLDRCSPRQLRLLGDHAPGAYD